MAVPSVMRSSVSEDIDRDRTLRERIEKANQMLDEKVRSSVLNRMLRASGITILADWRAVEDSTGHPLLELTLSSPEARFSASTRLSREELLDDSQLRFKLHRVWGEALQDYSHLLLEGLLET